MSLSQTSIDSSQEQVQPSAAATLDVSQAIEISGPIGDAYKALLYRITDGSATPDNRAMPMVLEQWPGGRWFRDLGNGQGHLWGFVQVIKPPTLIEIHGPLFMSYPVIGHVQFRLTQVTGGAELFVRHRVLGEVEEPHLLGIRGGWDALLQDVKRMTESDKTPPKH